MGSTEYNYCTVLYCTVLYCTVLYCTVLYCTVLYCTVLYCTVLHCTVLCNQNKSYPNILWPSVYLNAVGFMLIAMVFARTGQMDRAVDLTRRALYCYECAFIEVSGH